MASIKNLKKEIDYHMSVVLNECFYVMEYNSNVDTKAVMNIAGDTIEKHREFRIRAIHSDGKENTKLVKHYYSNLLKELLEATDHLLSRLSDEVKKVV